MARLILTIEIDAVRKRDAEALAERIDELASGCFEDYTMEHGRPMTMNTWAHRPKPPKISTAVEQSEKTP